MKHVQLILTLPEGMTEYDLNVLLKDALSDFRHGRANGDARTYVENNPTYRKMYDERYTEVFGENGLEKKIEEVQKRLNWSKALSNQNFKIADVTEEIETQHSEE